MVSRDRRAEPLPEGHDSQNEHDHNSNSTPALEACIPSHNTTMSVLATANKGLQLTSVNLDGSDISQLPNSLNEILPSLSKFSACNNALSVLPDSLGSCSQLQELLLNNNRLTSLPDSLSQLKHLKVLQINANCLERLHPEIGQNVSLEILRVADNQLRRLPATFGLLKNLEVLEASGNRLEIIPTTIHYLQQLRVVNLSSNYLRQLPETFGQLGCLVRLDLSDNKLDSLGEVFHSVQSIQSINLDDNLLTKCPMWFSELTSVEEIRIKCNVLCDAALPADFGLKNNQLKVLDLRGNYIQKLPCTFGHLNNLESLHLGRYICQKGHYHSSNWLSHLPDSFSRLTSLTQLSLEDNHLQVLPPDLNNLVCLQDLFLASNMLVDLPSSFTKLAALKTCRLSRNQLVALPEDFGLLQHLVELYLDNNKLRSLPSSMVNLTNLEMFDVSANKLREISSEFLSSLVKLKGLNLMSNRCHVPTTSIPAIKVPVGSLFAEPEANHPKSYTHKHCQCEDDHHRGQLGESDETRGSPQPAESSHEARESDDDLASEVDQCSLSSYGDGDLRPLSEREDNWDEGPECGGGRGSGSGDGQFDLDDDDDEEASGKPLIQLPRFSVNYGGSLSDISFVGSFKYLSTPYVHHPAHIHRSLYHPVLAVTGQFENHQGGGEEGHGGLV